MCITWILMNLFCFTIAKFAISVKTEARIRNGSEGFWCVWEMTMRGKSCTIHKSCLSIFPWRVLQIPVRSRYNGDCTQLKYRNKTTLHTTHLKNKEKLICHLCFLQNEHVWCSTVWVTFVFHIQLSARQWTSEEMKIKL